MFFVFAPLLFIGFLNPSCNRLDGRASRVPGRGRNSELSLLSNQYSLAGQTCFRIKPGSWPDLSRKNRREKRSKGQ